MQKRRSVVCSAPAVHLHSLLAARCAVVDPAPTHLGLLAARTLATTPCPCSSTHHLLKENHSKRPPNTENPLKTNRNHLRSSSSKHLQLLRQLLRHVAHHGPPDGAPAAPGSQQEACAARSALHVTALQGPRRASQGRHRARAGRAGRDPWLHAARPQGKGPGSHTSRKLRPYMIYH